MMTPQDPRSPEQVPPEQPRLPRQPTQPLGQVPPISGPPQYQGQATQPYSPPTQSGPSPEPHSHPHPHSHEHPHPHPEPAATGQTMPLPTQGQTMPTQGQTMPAQGQPMPAQGQPMPGQPGMAPGTSATGVYDRPAAKTTSFMQAFMPEPSKAPPLEWAALAVGVVLALSGVLPWLTGPNNLSVSGLDGTNGSGDGLVVLGAGLASVVMGFIGLSRDSISLAAGQAIIGIITLIFALLNLNPGEGRSPGPGVYVALIASIVLIGLSLYNAYDARRKGAKY